MAKKKSGGKSSAPARPNPRSADRTMRDLHALLEKQKFETIEEANAFMQRMLDETDGIIPAAEAETPEMQAQDLVYDAYEIQGRKKRVELAKKALSIHEDCAEAYILLAEETANTDEEARDLFARAVTAAERTLGPKYFADKEYVGHFWGMIETRPYMRAREGLSLVLWELGQHDEAISHCQDMLRLNPGDNQGLRYTLVVWLVVAGRDDEAQDLLDSYAQDDSATMSYMRALLRFRKEGASLKARSLLRDAFAVNPHIPMFLTFIEKMPEDMPEHYSLGSEEEAKIAISEMAEAWMADRKALDWFIDEFARLAEELMFHQLPEFRA